MWLDDRNALSPMDRVVYSGFLSVNSHIPIYHQMKRLIYLIGAVVVFDIALFGVNQVNEWRGTKLAAASLSESAVSAPVRAEQKTYRVTFRVAPVVQSQAKNQ